MKRTPAEDLAKFNESVSILIKAYLNDTLVHEQCTACAVGNIIAHSCGFSLKKRYSPEYESNEFVWRDANGDVRTANWRYLFVSDGGNGWEDYQTLNPAMSDRDYIKQQVEPTGYWWQELARIEKAFERITYQPTEDEKAMSDDSKMFAGLMDVISELASIHSIDLETTEAARKLFVKV